MNEHGLSKLFNATGAHLVSAMNGIAMIMLEAPELAESIYAEEVLSVLRTFDTALLQEGSKMLGMKPPYPTRATQDDR